MRLFASGSEWWVHSLAVVKGGGSFAVVVVNEGGGHSLAVVKGLQSTNNL